MRSSISVAFVLVCSSVLSVPFPPSLPGVWAIYWDLVFSLLPLSHLGLSVTGARVRGPDTGGSWLGCGFGQASRVFWRLGGVIAIAAPGPLGHLTSTCDVGVNALFKVLHYSKRTSNWHPPVLILFWNLKLSLTENKVLIRKDGYLQVSEERKCLLELGKGSLLPRPPTPPPQKKTTTTTTKRRTVLKHIFA